MAKNVVKETWFTTDEVHFYNEEECGKTNNVLT